MTNCVIPESAPFTPEQRAWLNGFFAGMMSITSHDSGSPNGSAAPAFLATSNNGTSGNGASGNGHSPEVETAEDFPWHDPTLPLPDRLQLAEGKPIERRLMAAMAQLDCGACGYLCKTYSEAIALGAEKDLAKCTPGGTETAKTLKRLLSERSSVTAVSGANGGQLKTNGAVAKVPVSTRSAPFSARLLSSTCLTHQESPKDTRHVEIDLGDATTRYEPGDALGILPLNCDELVENVLRALGANGEELVWLSGNEACALRQVLKSKRTLSRCGSTLLELFRKHAKNEKDLVELQQALESDSSSVAGFDVAELLDHFPGIQPPLDEFVSALSLLQPRLYSISSSLRAHPRQVHLTVGVVRFENLGRWRYGVASHFLGVRSQPGDELCVFVQSSPRFRLPTNPEIPIIMVGPGTGIAPFRAFLEEREATNAKGRNWLFFGNQYMGYDYLYRDQLESWHDAGFLTRLDLAFSRDKAEKIYVQNRMLENGSELWRWLQEGAHFYLCGDAKRMAPDVDRALNEIAVTHGRLSAEQAKAYVQDLSKTHRYHRDVY